MHVAMIIFMSRSALPATGIKIMSCGCVTCQPTIATDELCGTIDMTSINVIKCRALSFLCHCQFIGRRALAQPLGHRVAAAV